MEGLNKEGACELCEYLKDPKDEAKIMALDGLIQLIQDTKNREVIVNETQTLDETINLLNAQKHTVKASALKLLVNLSQYVECAKLLVAKDIVLKLRDFILSITQGNETITIESFKLEGVDKLEEKEAEDSKDVAPSYQYTFKDSNTEELSSLIELSLLVLTNVTLVEEGKRKLIETKSASKGKRVIDLLPIFTSAKYEESFHLFSSVLANISSAEEGRKMLIKFPFILWNTLNKSVQHKNPKRRVGSIHALRNCLFLYTDEQFLKTIVDEKNDTFQILLARLAQVSLASKVITKGDARLKAEFNIQEALPEERSEILKEEFDLLLDIFLVLTNVSWKDNRLNFDKVKLISLFNALYDNLTGALQDKAQVIAIIFGAPEIQ